MSQRHSATAPRPSTPERKQLSLYLWDAVWVQVHNIFKCKRLLHILQQTNCRWVPSGLCCRADLQASTNTSEKQIDSTELEWLLLFKYF